MKMKKIIVLIWKILKRLTIILKKYLILIFYHFIILKKKDIAYRNKLNHYNPINEYNLKYYNEFTFDKQLKDNEIIKGKNIGAQIIIDLFLIIFMS